MHLAHSFQNHPLGFRTQHRKIQALLKRSFFAWDTRLQSVDALYALNTNVRASKKCWRSQLIMLVHLFSNREHTKQLSDSRAYVSPLTRWRSEDRTRIIDEENTRRTEKCVDDLLEYLSTYQPRFDCSTACQAIISMGFASALELLEFLVVLVGAVRR